MTEDGNRFRINEPAVVHEHIDGETIILNLDTGNYYSLVEVGAAIWDYLVKGVSIEEIFSMVRANYRGVGDEVETSIKMFLEQLRQEGLIISTAGRSDAMNTGDRRPAEFSTGDAPTFSLPVLNKYTDLQDLLLLDPIHEVDAAGWPSTKTHD